MSDSEELVCKPTKWFLWRAVAMAVMFGVGAFLFFKDWKFGYPEGNVERFYYLAFEKAKTDFKSHLEDGKSTADWESYAGEQKVFAPVDSSEETAKDVAATVPSDTDLETVWPDILVKHEGYSKLYEEEQNKAIPPGWKKFSNSGGRTWGETSKDKLKSEKEIKQQLYIAILCSALFLVALFFFFRTMGRSMRVSGEGFTPAGGKLIPFSDIKRIDARKWDTKGLAFIFFEKGGTEKKAKVDGMVYGQFKEEEGAPAQKLYDRILANFQGELIELAPDEDEEAEEKEEENKVTNDSED